MSTSRALTRDLVRCQVWPPDAVELRRRAAGAVVFLHQIEARQRHVELGAVGVLDQHQVLLPPDALDLPQAQVAPDAVLGVDHEIAVLEVLQVGEEGRGDGFSLFGPRHQLRGREQVLRAVENGPRVGENRPFADRPLHQHRAGDRARKISFFFEIGAAGLGGVLEPELVGDAKLAEDLRPAARHRRARKPPPAPGSRF